MASTGSSYSQIIQGIVLVLIMLFIPRGIGETVFSFGDKLLGRLEGKSYAKHSNYAKQGKLRKHEQ